MRKAIFLCAAALALGSCAEPRHYSYPPSYEKSAARRSFSSPSHPVPANRHVKPLGAGLLTAQNVGGYMDSEERELRADLRRSGVGVSRPGDAITLFLRDDFIFEANSTDLSDRGAQILSAVASIAAKYDSTTLAVNGYTDTAGPPDHDVQLSQDRAETVAKALVAAGIDARRISARGLGATHLKIPTGPNVRERRNRRIEILITPKMAG